MEQFSNFTFVKQISLEVLGRKFNMSYRLNCLLEEQIDLTKYGEGFKHISFSPLIRIPFCPSVNIFRLKRRWRPNTFGPQQAVEADEAQFFA